MGRQSWHYGGHPPACTCVQCNERRSSRPPLKDPPRRDHASIFRSRGRKPSVALRVVRVLLALALLIAISLFVFHAVRVKDVTTPFRMIGEDIRVAYRCPGESIIVVDFVNRGSIEQAAIEVGESLGVDWVGSVCDGLFGP